MNDESSAQPVTPLGAAALSAIAEEFQLASGCPGEAPEPAMDAAPRFDFAKICPGADAHWTVDAESGPGSDWTGVALLGPAPEPICEIRPASDQDRAMTPPPPSRPRRGHRLAVPIGALLGVFGLGWIAGSNWSAFVDLRNEELAQAAVDALVERIIRVESDGDPNAKNKHSSATGAGQFLDGTWLEMIRTHRPDLAEGRSEKSVLDLRRDPRLAREIAKQFAERNAAMLRKRGFPVTPGSLYLAHFAGPAGALAILSFPAHGDAASLMASADSTGRMTREKIVAANPFLGDFTAADLKNWADRKMRGSGSAMAETPTASLAAPSGAPPWAVTAR